MAHGTPTASGHGQAKPGEIAIGVIIGRTSEFFDFFVYAIASVLVFPTLVFPYVDRLTGTLYSFALFALAEAGCALALAWWAMRWFDAPVQQLLRRQDRSGSAPASPRDAFARSRPAT